MHLRRLKNRNRLHAFLSKEKRKIISSKQNFSQQTKFTILALRQTFFRESLYLKPVEWNGSLNNLINKGCLFSELWFINTFDIYNQEVEQLILEGFYIYETSTSIFFINCYTTV